MAKQNYTIFWIIGGILIAFLVASQLELFTITGSEKVVREFPSEVDAGTNQGIKYVVKGASGKWGVSIIDGLSCPGYTIPAKKIVLISDTGSSLIVFYQLPNKEGLTCTFSGNYKFGDKMVKTFPSQTISTRVITKACQSNADSNNDGVISRSELGSYINKWIAGTKTRTTLGKAIMEWVGGC